MRAEAKKRVDRKDFTLLETTRQNHDKARFAAHTRFANWRGLSPWRARRDAAEQKLFAQHPGLVGVVKEHPFAAFEALAAETPAVRYSYVSPHVSALIARVAEPLRSPYLCGLLLFLMGLFEVQFETRNLADEFAQHYADAFHRIIDQIDDAPDFASLSKDSFLKDLWIARVMMIPAVAQCWWPHSGLQLRALMSGDAKGAWRAFSRCGGRRPMFEGHLHDPHVGRGYWSAEGWAEALRLLALALPSFPGHRGAFSTSWYFDPRIAEISPRLAFVGDLALATGARRFRVGPSADALANATTKSPTRRRLVAEGNYTPTDYAVVWARRDLIAAQTCHAVETSA